MSRLDSLIERAEPSSTISGEDAFRLHDTYGFPIDLTVELAGQAGYDVDVDGFRTALAEQRERSRANIDAFVDASRVRAPLYAQVDQGTSKFLGYDEEQCRTRIVAILGADSTLESLEAGESAEVVLAETPFYAEAGGQVGDTGEISTSTGVFRVTDTRRPAPDVVVHIGEVVEGFIEAGQDARAAIASERRADIRRNHTATHLLHAALRRVLGPDTEQAGSLVAPDRLRFDFTSHRALGSTGLDEVAAIANGEVIANKQVVSNQESFNEAVERGAMALFGEKYGDVVRTIEVPDYSLELCGGTHVASTGEIGPIVVLGESSIGSGVRRIEALTGTAALNYVARVHRLAQDLSQHLRTPLEGLEVAVSTLQDSVREREREIEQLRLQHATSDIEGILNQVHRVGDTSVVSHRTDARDRDTILQLGDRIRDRLRSGVVVLGGQVDGQAALVAMVTPDAVERGIHAGRIIQTIAPIVGGRGGGRPEMAQGGGDDVEKIDEALAAVDNVINQQAG